MSRRPLANENRNNSAGERPMTARERAKAYAEAQRGGTRGAGSRSRPAGNRPAGSRSSSSSRDTRSRSTTSSRSGGSKSRESSTSGPASSSGAPRAKKQARPAWDVKGRLQDLESFTGSLKQQVSTANANVAHLQQLLKEREENIVVLSTTKEQTQEDLTHTRLEVEQMASKRRELMQQVETLKAQHELERSKLESKLRAVTSDKEDLQLSLSVTQNEVSRLKRELLESKTELGNINEHLACTKSDLEASVKDGQEKAQQIRELQDNVCQLKETVEELEARNRDGEMERRKLHNQMQELKGNIRVFCRARPLLEGEQDETNESLFEFPPHNGRRTLEIQAPGGKGVTGSDKGDRNWEFNFDKVFQPGTSQGEVFEEISQLVQSSLDGYNTCIFTYGQTGSGKTYTMEGPAGEYVEPEERGMITRAVEQVFETAEQLKELGWTYEMSAVFVEIYNETLKDLLANGSTSKDIKHRIIHGKDGSTEVQGAKCFKVEMPRQVYTLLEKAKNNRSVGSTNMNEHSSRSHSVFQLTLKGFNTITRERSLGILNLVDLAGSERLNSSKAKGARLKETQNINKSLSCLGDVIASLANSDKHIPYRNSKLTYLLQNSLGGSSSKTLMFVNISPRVQDLNETLSSLRFATKVNSAEIGIARKGGKLNFNE